MKQTRFPKGWDEDRVRRVLGHYEAQSDEEAVAEDEAAYESTTHTAMARRSGICTYVMASTRMADVDAEFRASVFCG